MALELYRRKRNFGITPEPKGKAIRRKSKDLAFVIQKHRASHMHYDFRLELDGVLLSWAVPKGPSLDPSHRRLAMHVEDHPLEYGEFEGTIPPKQYGAGTVLLWDRGTWVPKGDPVADYKKGRLKFRLDGEKLQGGWMLVQSRGGKYDGDKAWFLIKENDEHARRGEPLVIEALPDSVATGRTLEEIAEDPDRVWRSDRSVKENVKRGALRKKKPRIDPGALSGARKSGLPPEIAPELATLVKAPPRGDEWLHEMKLDGYRMVCRIEGGAAELVSRNGKDWSANFPSVQRAAARLPVESAWLDGEVVVLKPDGRTSFQALQNALTTDHAAKLHYFVFDLLYLDGYDLRRVPLVERKRALETLLESAPVTIKYSAHIEGGGEAFFEQACKLGLEGMISKRAQSIYLSGRCRDWLKVKCSQRQEMVVGGYTDPEGARSGFGALLLGVYEPDGGLRYSGRVGTGFNEDTLRALHERLQAIETGKPAFSNPPRGYQAKGVHWVEPRLVAEIEFTEWTDDGTLRHPSFQGLREDKKASEVVRERAAETGAVAARRPSGKPAKKAAKKAVKKAVKKSSKNAMKKTAAVKKAVKKKAAGKKSAAATATRTMKRTREAAPASAGGGDGTVAGVAISNPSKVLYPEDGITKLELARYYESVADWILPHLHDRPLTLVRCPSGWEKSCFYQKHPAASVSPAIERVTVKEGKGDTLYMMANSKEALVAMLQMGAIELHPFGSSAPRLACPDRLIFDFDPADDISWDTLLEGVRMLKTLLEELGLETFVKTTGGKGLHVVVPIRPTLGWDVIKPFTRSVAELMVRSFPERFVATVTKAKRHGRIFVDYLRNGEGATAIAPYSLRARAHAPVATPITWDELDADIRREHFNVRNVPQRLAKLKRDPWAGFFDVRQSVTQAMIRKVGG